MLFDPYALLVPRQLWEGRAMASTWASDCRGKFPIWDAIMMTHEFTVAAARRTGTLLAVYYISKIPGPVVPCRLRERGRSFSRIISPYCGDTRLQLWNNFLLCSLIVSCAPSKAFKFWCKMRQHDIGQHSIQPCKLLHFLLL